MMRLAPVPIAYSHYYPDRIADLTLLLTESSRPTHGSDQCLPACACFGIMLAALWLRANP